MKPIYKSLILASMTLSVSLSLQGQIYDGESTSKSTLSSELLDSLRVELTAPNELGARDLIKSGECTVDGSDLIIVLNADNWIKGATYRIQVLATFGTQTQVIYSLDVTVPHYETLLSEMQEYGDEVVVVSTIGVGNESGADATVYAKDGKNNALVTTPLSIRDGVANGAGAVASGYAEGAGSYIEANGFGAVASGHTEGAGSYIEANGAGAVASGYVNSTSGNIIANSDGSQAFGIGVQAEQEAQMVVGMCNVVDEDGSYQFIVGNGEDDQNRSNAFAVTKSGELALFEADGTPVILTAEDLKALIASLS